MVVVLIFLYVILVIEQEHYIRSEESFSAFFEIPLCNTLIQLVSMIFNKFFILFGGNSHEYLLNEFTNYRSSDTTENSWFEKIMDFINLFHLVLITHHSF